MADQIVNAGLRLLDAINELRAKGRTDKTVHLDADLFAHAELERGSALGDEAVWWLLREGALRQDHAANAQYGGAVGAADYGRAFRITRVGLDLLRRYHNQR